MSWPRLSRTIFTFAMLVFLAGAVASDSPLLDAAMRADAEAIRALLEEGELEVNVASGDGMTALHWAAVHGQPDVIDLLLSRGADLEAATRIGKQTPLHLASEAGREESALRLVAAGADVTVATHTGVTPLHYASRAGLDGLVAALLAAGADPNTTENAAEQTPLMFASASNRTAVVKLLLEGGADPDRMTRVEDIATQAEIDRAARRVRDQTIAQFRSEVPLEARQEWRPTPQQVQAAMKAARKVQEELEREYQEEDRSGARWQEIPDAPLSMAQTVRRRGGFTALHLATREGSRDAAHALLDGGASLDLQSGGDETSPLLMSLINGHFDLAMELLDRGADPTLPSDLGVTPLFQVIHIQYQPRARYPQQEAYKQQQTNYYELMERLLEMGVDPNARLTRHLWYSEYNFSQLGVDFWGMTPFFRAAHALDVRAMKLLVDHGADPTIPTRAPPRRAAGYGVEDEVDHSGLPPMVVGGDGVHPIHAVAGVGHGAGRLSGADGSGWASSVHQHVPNGWMVAARYLVEELGANVNERDHNGFSPIHWAAGRGDTEMVQYFLDHGGDPLVLSRRGITTVDIANGPEEKLRPYFKTMELLMSHGAKNNDRCVIC